MELLSEQEVLEAVKQLRRGEVVAFPTETVYGLGAPIFSEKSIRKIFELKKRPLDNPLIAHISDLEQLERIVISRPESFSLLSDAFFPGPLTVILPAHPDVPKIATAGLSTIGVRMPSHPLALELIAQLGEPLVAPSANLSGTPSATTAEHVAHDFGDRLGYILDGGPCLVGVESTVVSLIDRDHPVIYRPGGVSKEQLEEVLGVEVLDATFFSENQPASSPGLKYRHYAPKANVLLFESLEAMHQHSQTPHKKRLILSSQDLEGLIHQTLSRQNLFHLLRYADLEHYEEVLVYCDEAIKKDSALMNRLIKASNAKQLGYV